MIKKKIQTHCKWKKFIELFISGEYVINGHHAPVSKMCGGCDISWDFIVKQETMDEDNEYLLRFINAPTHVHVAHSNQNGFVNKEPFSYRVVFLKSLNQNQEVIFG